MQYVQPHRVSFSTGASFLLELSLPQEVRLSHEEEKKLNNIFLNGEGANFESCTGRHLALLWPWFLVTLTYDLKMKKTYLATYYPAIICQLLEVESRRYMSPVSSVFHTVVTVRIGL